MRLWTLFILLFLFSAQAFAMHEFKKDTLLMGVSFSVAVVHEDAAVAQNAIEAAVNEIVRIENLISSWDPDSETSEVNRQAGVQPVVVSVELLDLIQRCKKISELSNGYFDISFASIHKVWDFKEFDQHVLPSPEAIKESVKLIDHQKIIIDREKHTIFLADAGMRIGFGAIGKGYAADRVKTLLLELGVENGLVNAGGDLIGWGRKADGSAWRIGVADPFEEQNILGTIDATNMAIVTSGNYERFVEIDGKRYCHIIDPKTGWPVEHLASVTIVCADAEVADALATTVFVLGKEDGLKLIEHLEGVECLIIDGAGAHYLSKNWRTKHWIDEGKG